MFSLSLQKQIPLTFAIVLILLAIIGFFTYRSSESFDNALATKTHAQETLQSLDETLILLLNAETSARGFQLTGNDLFLDPMKDAQQNLPGKIRQLHALFADNPLQLEQLAKLESKGGEKMLVLRQNIETRRTQGLNQAISVTNSGRGKQLMDEFRAIIAEMKAIEEKQVKESEANLQDTVETTKRMILLSIMAGILSLGLANFAIFRSVKDKNTAEGKLIETNRTLENRVRERTAELETKNELLADQAETSKLLETKRNVAIKAGNLGMWTLTPDGNFAEIDKAGLQMFGLSEEQFSGDSQKVFDQINEEDFAALEKSFNNALENKSDFGGEFRVYHPDGETRWINCVSQPQLDDEGNVKDFVGFCRDITVSKTYENDLRESELFVRAILDSLSAHIAVLDRDGTIRAVNRAWKVFAQNNCLHDQGTDKTDVGQNYLKVSEAAAAFDEETKFIVDELKEVLHGRKSSFSREYPCHSPEQERWFLLQVSALQSLKGGAVVSHIDISSRKTAEENLRVSEEFSRSVIESSPDCVKVINLDGTLHSMNNNGLYIMEIDDFTLFEGKDWTSFWEGEGRIAADKAIKTAQAGSTANFVGFCRTAKGTAKWWDVSVAPIRGADGMPARILSISRDITEKQIAADNLRRSQARLTLALQAGRAGTFEWDIKNNINIWSPELEQMYRMLPGSFEGDYESWRNRVLPEDLEIFEQGLEKVFRNKDKEYNFEFRAIMPDGDQCWFAGRSRFEYDAENNAERMYGINVDISEIKEAEIERRTLLERERAARKEAEIANRMRDEFLATVSHELRAPLNSILGWAKLMQQGKLDPATSVKAVETIVRNATAQNRLIEDLLDVSRIISGKLRLEILKVQPGTFVEAAFESVRPAADAKNIKLHLEEDRQVSHISGDPNRLQQVVWNLLSNAIKFTPNGGNVYAAIRRTNGSVEISVKDDGVGIKKEFLPHVFDRFSQADASSIRKFGGLGLGLAIVRHITEMHGGTVSVESEGENKGTTFTVKLPVTVDLDSKDSETLSLSVDEPSENKLKLSLDGLLILVVDDEADSRQLLVQALTQYGATITAASSAEQALEELSRKHPDVIISDIGMPDEDGYSLMRKVRALEDEKAQIPAVALTAFARAQDRTRALAAGFQSHVAKPVELEELVAVIASLTGRLQIS